MGAVQQALQERPAGAAGPLANGADYVWVRCDAGSRFVATHRPSQTTRRCAHTAAQGACSMPAYETTQPWIHIDGADGHAGGCRGDPRPRRTRAFATSASNGRLTGAANEMLLTFMTARNEAVRRQLRTSVCPSATPDDALAICDERPAGGFIAFIDTNSNCQRDDDEEFVSSMRRRTAKSTTRHQHRAASAMRRAAFGAGGRPAGQRARRVLRRPRHQPRSRTAPIFRTRAASKSWPPAARP